MEGGRRRGGSQSTVGPSRFHALNVIKSATACIYVCNKKALCYVDIEYERRVAQGKMLRRRLSIPGVLRLQARQKSHVGVVRFLYALCCAAASHEIPTPHVELGGVCGNDLDARSPVREGYEGPAYLFRGGGWGAIHFRVGGRAPRRTGRHGDLARANSRAFQAELGYVEVALAGDEG